MDPEKRQVIDLQILSILLILSFYSYRKHSIGSSRAALRAGQTPKISPTATLTVNPVVTAQVGIEAGRLGIRSMMSFLIPTAARTPMTAPTNLTVLAPDRN